MSKIIKIAFIIIPILLILGIFIIKVLPLFLPIKYAITEEQIDQSRNYIIVEIVLDSGTCRYEIANNHGFVRPGREVALVGYDPIYLFNYGISHGFENRFVLYGEKVHRDYVYTAGGQAFYLDNVFEVKDWDILKPISRSDIFNFPKAYITFLDAAINPITITEGYIWDFSELKAEFNSSLSTSKLYGRLHKSWDNLGFY